jgi:ABC-type transporter MlaC component
VTEEVLAAIRKDKALQAGDSRKLAALVDAKILPHFDFRRATQIAVGAAWRRATPSSRRGSRASSRRFSSAPILARSPATAIR